MSTPRPRPTPRKRAPEAVQPAQEPVTVVVEMPLLPSRSDDPPIYREMWNERWGLPAAP